MIDKAKGKTLSRQQELMRAIDFTMRDLAANRIGRLSVSQHKNLATANTKQAIFWGCFCCIPTLVVLAFAGVYYQEWKGDVLLVTSPFFIVLLLFTVYAGRQIWTLRREINEGHVQSVQGLAVVQTQQGFSITVNDMTLYAPLEAILRIKHLEPHIIYYLPRSKVVVSVEVIEE